MLITNGKIIIAATAEWDFLKEQVEEIQSRARGELDNTKLKFKPNKKDSHFIVPKEVDIAMLLRLAKPNIDIQLRSIKGEEIQLPNHKTRSIRYDFSQEDLAKIGGEMAVKYGERSAEENRIAGIKKKSKTVIDDIEKVIQSSATKITQGYEMREHVCVVKLDFSDKKKYFLHPDSGDVLDIADLEPEDYQLSMELHNHEQLELGNELEENAHLKEKDDNFFEAKEGETVLVKTSVDKDGNLQVDNNEFNDDELPH